MGNDCFNAATSRAKVFFEYFDSFFNGENGIDSLFNQIDAAGGEKDEILKKILEKLKEYHHDVYNGFVVSSTENEYFGRIVVRNKSKLEEVVSSLSALQNGLQNYLSHDMIWDGQKQCLDIITDALDYALSALQKTNIVPQDKSTIYRISHILCELIADCSISICGLIPLSQWNYGTEYFACLSAEDQLLSLLNKAILTDRMYLCIHSLRDTVMQINSIASGFYFLNWEMYYYIGFLNYKIHSYKDAIGCFEKITCNKETKKYDEKKWFHSSLLLAYCYEYQNKYEEAIGQLACPIEILLGFANCVQYDELTGRFEDVLNKFLSFIKESNAKESLLSEYFHLLDITKELPLHSEQIEIFHALAHCINEYAIDKRNAKNCDGLSSEAVNNICYGKMIFFARGLMKFIASLEPEYWTCYATIHGECADYSKALIELKNAREALAKKGRIKETLIAEINFFDYYFNQMIGIDLPNIRKEFECYCCKYSDNDAECHIKIFEFRNELKRYYSTFSLALLSFDDDSPISEKALPAIPNELNSLYEELCKQKPSLYMNVNVRAELIKMQCAFVCLKLYREYLIDQKPNKYIELINAFKRFFEVRFDYDLSERNSEGFNDKEFNIEQALFRGINNQKSLVYCLHNSDSIFLLAPISGVVVFEYQTGKLNKLFDQNAFLFSFHTTKAVDFGSVQNEIGESSIAYRAPHIKKIEWDKLPEGTHVYCWKKSDAKRLVIAWKNGIENRQIIDDKTFESTIYEIIDKSKSKCRAVGFDNFTHKCKGIFASLGWAEIINETNEPIEVLVYWKEEDPDIKCFILKKSELGNTTAQSKCQWHESIYDAQWDYSAFFYGQEDTERRSDIGENAIAPLNMKESFEVTGLLRTIQKEIERLTGQLDSSDTSSIANTKRRKREFLIRIETYITENDHLISEKLFDCFDGFLGRINTAPIDDVEEAFKDLLRLMGEN